VTRDNLLSFLSRDRFALLRELGRLADQKGVALYLVGGVVRDLLLKRENWDLDLTVEGDGISFAKIVAEQYGAGIASFERFATARLILPDGRKIDIASTRRESYAQPAALPDVKPASLKDDLYRRDFTINAMAIQLNAGRFGWLHDPYGGQRDLKAKTIRVLHEGSFVDDPTRVFRAIRFAQRFGFRLEPVTRRLLREEAAADAIASLSGPRLSNEILLLMKERDPRATIEQLVRLRLLRFLHPKLRYTRRVQRVLATIPRAYRWWRKQAPDEPFDEALVYLMGLLSGAGPDVLRAVIQRLQLSVHQSHAIEWAGKRTDQIALRLRLSRAMSPSEVYRLLNNLPSAAAVLLYAKGLAMENGRALPRFTRRLSRFLGRDRGVTCRLTGEDLKRLGLKPGPQFKRILDRVLDGQLNGAVTTKANARALARRLATSPQ
jgi:tRNA nucleotidyltransferase (CCA-adding enzyme)